MTVTKVEAVTKVRFKVEIDGQLAFALYKGELSRYKIKEDAYISQETVAEIKKEVILKRAKIKAIHLLSDMDRTQSQLRIKLKQGLYTEDVIEEAVAYVKSFGYVDDQGYAKRFIESRKGKKSKKEIYALLAQKGIPKETLEQAMEAGYDRSDSQHAIEQLMKKKRYDPRTATAEEKRKIMGSLTRKGFSYEDIRQVIQVSEWDA